MSDQKHIRKRNQSYSINLPDRLSSLFQFFIIKGLLNKQVIESMTWADVKNHHSIKNR